jgi:aspartate kinase
MRIVVHKYGGTSLATPKQRELVARNIIAAREGGFALVVVVSAMGRRGSPYATDTLLDLLKSVDSFPRPRESDLLVSCGEQISAAVLATLLNKLGCPAMALTGGQAGVITNSVFTEADILDVKPEKLQELAQQGIVPVVAGFQGKSAEGEITTLGRGGSDTSAVALAAALRCEAAVIYTDVSSIKTADPKMVEDARPIRCLNYHEVLEMAVEGARVIHPRAVELAMTHEVRVIITSLSDKEGEPTEIAPHCRTTGPGETIRAITHIADVSLFKINVAPEILVAILEKIAHQGLSLDLIGISLGAQNFTVPGSNAPLLGNLLQGEGIDYHRTDDCCKLTLVGAGIRGVPGVMAKIYRPLADKGVPVLTTADSYTQIAILVPMESAKVAATCLHRIFFEGGEKLA